MTFIPQLYTSDWTNCFDQFWVQARKLVAFPSTTMLAGSFGEVPEVAVYPNATMQDGKRKVGCAEDPSNISKATIASPNFRLNICKTEVDLAWTPPPRCKGDQVRRGDTMKCRVEDDLYFFTYTMGSTRSGKFWVGQNSFGFSVDYDFE